jgi:hypothetical protein
MVSLTSAALLIAVAIVPALLLDIIGYRNSRALRALSWLRRRRARRVPAPPEVGAPAIEQLAVQLRRLSAVLTATGPVSSVRRFGVERAYDEVLVQACGALGIAQQLGQVPPEDREFERLRVEAMLQEAGLVLRGPASGVLPRRKPNQGDGVG